MIVSCDYCGEGVEKRKQSVKGSDNNFCDMSCYGDWMSDNKTGKDHHMWDGGKEAVTCEYCSETIKKNPSNVAQTENHFCDVNCYGNYQSENKVGEKHSQYERIQVECAVCDVKKEVIPSYDEKVEDHFCDEHTWHDKVDFTGENNPSWKGGKKRVECDYCGEENEVYPYRLESNQMFFCDVDCRGNWATESFSGENHPLFQNYSENYGRNWLEMRGKVRDRDDGECQVCGVDKGELGQWPDVHHIEPVREFDEPEQANFLDNMISLCPSCHGKVEQGNLEVGAGDI